MIVAGMLMDGGPCREPAFSGVLVGFSPLDQRNGAELLHNRDGGADHKAGDGRRKHDRTEKRHAASVAGEGIRMTNVMGGIVDGVDMGKSHHADNEQAETHRHDGLKNDAQILGGNRQLSGLRLVHGRLLRTKADYSGGTPLGRP
jgi:hypothetical protein